MYIRFLLISLGFSLLFLSGCGSQKRVVVAQKKEIPSWYEHPPKSSPSDLYAVGSGRDKQTAITNALTQMISTLSVSISSKFSAKTVVKEGSVSSFSGVYTDESTSEVQNIRIGNYELLESQSLGFKNYVVLVKSNKKKLFLSMKKEIEQNFEIIEQERKSILPLHMMKHLSFYKKSKGSLASLPNTLLVMSELNPAFNGSEYLNKAQKIDAEYEELLSTITFSINSNSEATNLMAPIAKGISAKKLKIANGSGKKHFNIMIRSDIQRASSYGFTLARSAISITVKDSRGAVIGSNKLNITGQSSQGFGIAKENVALKLDALIEKNGIAEVLGLEL
ncbi:MAG: LPP20 family lipoprotein [Campylobacterota bacterium]